MPHNLEYVYAIEAFTDFSLFNTIISYMCIMQNWMVDTHWIWKTAKHILTLYLQVLPKNMLGGTKSRHIFARKVG